MTRLDEIEARAGKATPGPWESEDTGACCGSNCTPDGCHDNHPSGIETLWGPPQEEPGEFCAADAQFLAHSREDVPWLVARLRQAEAALAAVPIVRMREDALGWQCPCCHASSGVRPDGTKYHEPCMPDCWVAGVEHALAAIREAQ